MKKITLTALSFVLISVATHAQVYFRAGGGYAFPLATESIGEKHFRQSVSDGNTTTTTNTSENVKASYGSGVNFNVGGGFMFSEYFGFDVNVSYLSGKKFETSDIYVDTSPGFSGKDDFKTMSSSKTVLITPSFVISSGAGSHAPYGRFGVVVGLPKIKGEDSEYYDLDGTTTRNTNWEYKGGTSFGFQGAVGMNWLLSDNIRLYTEVNFISMTYYPKEYVITKYIVDGTDRLSQLSESQKKTEFVKKVDNNAPFDSTKPTQALQESKPLSSLSFQVGIIYSLAGKSM